MIDRQNLEKVAGENVVLGEGPVWDTRLEVLWWVDIGPGVLHRFDPGTAIDRIVPVGSHLSVVAPRDVGGLIAAVEAGFAFLDPDDGSLEVVAAVEGANDRTRMNDGACDAAGSFWAGSMALDGAGRRGSLYRLEPNLRATAQVFPVGISNGIDWSCDGETMYYVDSLDHAVDAFDFALDTGVVPSSRRRLIEIPAEDGLPDGLAVDSEDHLWVALYGGGCVRRYSPSGRLVSVVEAPTPNTTSCAFGGSDLTELFVTAGADALGDQVGSGGLYKTRPGVRGRSPYRFAG